MLSLQLVISLFSNKYDACIYKVSGLQSSTAVSNSRSHAPTEPPESREGASNPILCKSRT